MATIPFWFFRQHFLLAFTYVIVYKSITFWDSGRFSGQDSRGLIDRLPVFRKVHFFNDQDKRVFTLKEKRKKSLIQTVLVRGGNIRHLSEWFFSDAFFTLGGYGNGNDFSSFESFSTW